MDIKTAAGQLDTLSRLLREDGWGAHYIEACRTASAELTALAAEADAGQSSASALAEALANH